MEKELYCDTHEGNYINLEVEKIKGLNSDYVIYMRGKYMGEIWDFFLPTYFAEKFAKEILLKINSHSGGEA